MFWKAGQSTPKQSEPLGHKQHLFNNVNNLEILVRNLTIDMKKVGNYALPEVVPFQNNEIFKFLGLWFFLNTDSDTEK